MTKLTKDECIFFSRVAAYMVEKKMSLEGPGNIERACREVLKRDEELWLEVATRSEVGKAITSAMAESVYHTLRK